MSLLSLIILIIIGVIAYNFREELMAAAAFIGIFAGVGALLFWWWFDKPSLGAIVGCCLAVIIGSKIILQSRGERYSNVFGVAFRFISFPIWFLNRLQHILMEPWRYLTKNYIYSSPRKIMLLMAYPIEIILYILITPLRFLNAVLYNIFVYCISELYDLTLEVFVPGSYDEGKGSFWGWIIWFPVRVVKYPIFHGFLVIIEAGRLLMFLFLQLLCIMVQILLRLTRLLVTTGIVHIIENGLMELLVQVSMGGLELVFISVQEEKLPRGMPMILIG